jgi:hypothetical protein
MAHSSDPEVFFSEGGASDKVDQSYTADYNIILSEKNVDQVAQALEHPQEENQPDDSGHPQEVDSVNNGTFVLTKGIQLHNFDVPMFWKLELKKELSKLEDIHGEQCKVVCRPSGTSFRSGDEVFLCSKNRPTASNKRYKIAGFFMVKKKHPLFTTVLLVDEQVLSSFEAAPSDVLLEKVFRAVPLKFVGPVLDSANSNNDELMLRVFPDVLQNFLSKFVKSGHGFEQVDFDATPMHPNTRSNLLHTKWSSKSRVAMPTDSEDMGFDKRGEVRCMCMDSAKFERVLNKSLAKLETNIVAKIEASFSKKSKTQTSQLAKLEARCKVLEEQNKRLHNTAALMQENSLTQQKKPFPRQIKSHRRSRSTSKYRDSTSRSRISRSSSPRKRSPSPPKRSPPPRKRSRSKSRNSSQKYAHSSPSPTTEFAKIFMKSMFSQKKGDKRKSFH